MLTRHEGQRNAGHNTGMSGCDPLRLVMHVQPKHAGAVHDLLNRHRAVFLQPDETLEPDWIDHLLANEPLWSIVAPGNQLVGIIWWEALQPGVTATIHLVLDRPCIRAFYRQHLGQQMLQQAFSCWHLQQIQARFHGGRSQPPKWLLAHGFVCQHPATPTDPDTLWVRQRPV
jgi:hypothetical protein